MKLKNLYVCLDARILRTPVRLEKYVFALNNPFIKALSCYDPKDNSSNHKYRYDVFVCPSFLKRNYELT